jgi:hypothetical protein
MDPKSDEKAKEGAAPVPTASTAMPQSNPDLPVYYDSEPSSQPPQYGKIGNGAPVEPRTTARPQAHHTGSGVPASTVAALLADPEPETREKKSVRERWKDWKNRNFREDSEEKWDIRGSSSQWNVFGASVSGYDREKSRRLR